MVAGNDVPAGFLKQVVEMIATHQVDRRLRLYLSVETTCFLEHFRTSRALPFPGRVRENPYGSTVRAAATVNLLEKRRLGERTRRFPVVIVGTVKKSPVQRLEAPAVRTLVVRLAALPVIHDFFLPDRMYRPILFMMSRLELFPAAPPFSH